jgi:molybdenum cofactor biosynthesis enzyme MoaA
MFPLADSHPVHLTGVSAPVQTYSLEECPFETVIVDVTHSCNMACHNCYIPNRTIPDLDAAWLTETFRRLRARRFVRLVGGEPTLRDDLCDLVGVIRTAGHHPVLVTNGLKLADATYVRALKTAGLQILYLSMNGAFDDEMYWAIDAMRCADRKGRAFETARRQHIYTSIGMIVVRDRNEHGIAPLLAACLQSRNVRELHLRSVGAVGRFMKEASYDLDGLLDLFANAAGISPHSVDRRERSATSHDFTFGRLRVQLTVWPDMGNTRRGRLTPEGTVAPFFEHVLANEGEY